ncbi:aldehyde dehydrogenase [Candidatus Sumerlaeota bacterium]|nr:aldehyde dehydrogenase [Candidatus Sumerlaeota bacterium]
MADLLTRDEYLAIAKELSFPSNAHINGKFTAAKSGKTIPSINPATGETLTQIASCGEADVNYAVKKARQAFDSGVWSRKHPSERKEAMIKLSKLIKRHRHELAVMESLDSGKPVSDCATIDIPETIHCLTWYAEAADKIFGQISPTNDDAMGLIVREPRGVAACVLPWNFPMLMMAWKVGPALASGNSVIVKPAEQTSMTALRIAELAAEAGIPAGVLNVVPGLGETAGRAIGLHPDIDVVSFTGSTEVGRYFLDYSAKSNMKHIVLECGGKNPAVVLEDAKNLDNVAEHVVNAVFWNMGENCTSNSRLIVHEKIKDDLLRRIIDKVRDWRTGDPLEPNNRLGAMISQEHFDKVMGYIEKGKKEKGKVILGGKALKIGKGLFIPPTIFDNVTPKMTIAKEEIFGPVLAVMTVSSDDEAIQLANDTCYGLQASIFTSDVKRALRAARDVKAGTVTVNCYCEGDITTPFGGYKQSGFGGRDNGLQAFEQYTQVKTIWLDLSDSGIDAKLD